MLDLNSIEITRLTAEFLKNRFIYIFLGIAIIVLGILLFNKMLKSLCSSSTFNDFLLITVTIFILSAGMSFLFSEVDYCKVAVKVVPNEKLTIEQIKTSDKFIEKDGEYFYVKTFKRNILLESDKNFMNNQGRLLRETEQDFNDFVNTNYLKNNAVYIEDRGLERR